MSTPQTNDSMPLRETCDRCRELKVRCKKDESSTAAMAPCIRCARAGSNCLFSPKQPSGRPLTRPESRKTMGVSRAAHRAADGNSDAQWPAADFSYDELLSDMIEMEPSNCGGPMFDLIQSPEYDNDSPASSRTQGLLDPTERIVHQVSDLNLRIYRTTRAASNPRSVETTGTSLPSSDELIELTSGVMEIGARVIKPLDQPRPNSDNMALVPLPFGGAFFGDGGSLAASPPTPTQPPPAGGGFVDTSTILMILSCHDRLLGLFCIVCASLQSQEARRLEAPPPGVSPLASAQAVMTAELINHLLERLGRSQRQVIGALGMILQDQQQLPTPPAVQGEGLPRARSDDSGEWNAEETMVGVLRVKQAWLHTSIGMIKAIVSKQGTI